jgi:uncharacterized membrane protein
MLGLDIHYFPLALPFLLLLFGLSILLFAMIILNVLRYAYVKMGVAPQYVFLVLWLSLVGSYINIPIMRFPHERIVTAQEIVHYGMHYVIPVVRDWPGTVLAVNLGGAVIPTLASIYLMVKNKLYVSALFGTLIVAAICNQLAEPVPGIGIAIPVFIPPVAAAIIALLLSRRFAAPLAYICGCLGTLIGADLLNLGQIRGLGSPVASIGGAGTFDGIFVTGLMAVVFASLAAPRGSASER